MKIKKYLVFLILLLFSANVYAAGEKCEDAELKRLKSIAEKVEFRYEYEEINDEDEFGSYSYANFKIVASNLNPELKVLIINNYYAGDYREFKYNDSKTFTLDGFSSGDKVSVTIKGYVGNACSGKTLSVKKVSLPYYNSFYKMNECKEDPEFKYCSVLLDKKISDMNFYDEYEKFKNGTENDNNGKIIDENNGSKIDIKIVILIAGGVLLLSVIVILIARKRKRNQI